MLTPTNVLEHYEQEQRAAAAELAETRRLADQLIAERQAKNEAWHTERQRKHERHQLLQSLAWSGSPTKVRDLGRGLVRLFWDHREVVVTPAELREYFPEVSPPPSMAAKRVVSPAPRPRRCVATSGISTSSPPAAPDWNPQRGSYPSDPDGVCRHKASYLRDHLGGRVIFGYRTDQREPEHHAVLEIVINGKRLILDNDDIWPAAEAPFEPHAVPWIDQPSEGRQVAVRPQLEPDNSVQELRERVAKLELQKSLGDLDFDYDGERKLTIKKGGAVQEFRLPLVIYRGVYQTGRLYEPCDSVSHGGSVWIAETQTCDIPTTKSPNWRLAVKHGRDGRPGKSSEEQDNVT
jgi:hypothetical protein